MNRSLRHAAAALLPATLLASAALVMSGTASRAEAPPGPDDPAAAAATWSISKLTEGTHASGDHGLTADIVLGLAATGTAGDTQRAASDWLEANAGDYITRGAPGSGTVFAGGTAKLALVAAVEHRDPGDFGGHDLTGLLLGRLQESGRFTDAAPTGDMSNQFTQSLAVLALDRTGDVPDSAVDFLASTRCPDGGYPLSLRRNPDRCTSDTDSTGLAVQALLAVGRTADAEPALDWLEGRQRENGGFGYDTTSDPNSNSTALAVQALVAGDRDEAAERGLAWLRSMQVGCAGEAGDRGAVGYQEPVADGMALRATAQAIPALAGVPLGDIDAADSAPGAVLIDCAPGGGPGGGPGTPGDPQGASEGGSEGTSDGTADGASDGTSDGTSEGASGGTSDGASAGASDGASDGAAQGAEGGDAASGTPGTAGGASAQGPSAGGTDTAGGPGGNDPAPQGGSGGSGGLAATGSSSLAVLGGAAALLACGAAVCLVARRGRAAR
ncbi:prenyltransferase/squalene oxidase repeat-containing protein [Streptomyces litchfieldiae]|uniref:Prenyltransferase/squalene oxidase repeat-containing protein n=1 Tax=Streptomyces litchfieldiae TaxID=3075543 RepID=A0ABU2MHW9_9ACTN|nr:prenyltransferase/squalene oxidase repeat-containing protein [Streptomyces sp. DSM 44938]MDT0341110.1 prenyltransferase/squalene oxidase repeat-containing protein [Streptomyces sp. DSM 44938]